MDIKPANMEELTEVITAAQFHPISCHLLIYSSSKGTIRLCDMREKALCDEHAKCEYCISFLSFYYCLSVAGVLYIHVSLCNGFIHSVCIGSHCLQFCLCKCE